MLVLSAEPMMCVGVALLYPYPFYPQQELMCDCATACPAAMAMACRIHKSRNQMSGDGNVSTKLEQLLHLLQLPCPPPAFESCRGADAGAAVNRTVMVFACFNPP